MASSNSPRFVAFLALSLAAGALGAAPLFAAPFHAVRSTTAAGSTAGRCAAHLTEGGALQGCLPTRTTKVAAQRSPAGPARSSLSATDPFVPPSGLGQSSTIDPNGVATGGAH